MANMNVGTPRFYPDLVNWFMNRGVAQSGNYHVVDTDAGATIMGTFVTGSEAELFDMKPLNQVTFDTSADTDAHVIVSLDLQGAYTKNFVAILNHNMKTADARFKIAASATEAHTVAVDFTSATKIQTTEVLNANTIDGSSPYSIQPDSDGSTIVLFNADSNLRFWGIQFEGVSSNLFSSTDLSIGCILIGETYDMPNSPDLNVKRSIVYDKVNISESVGGQRYSNMTSIGRQVSSTSRSPFSTGTSNYTQHGGRIAYDLDFSYLASTDLMPNEYYTYQYDDDAVVEDVWEKTHGAHTPFIFTIDKDADAATNESEHIFARFAQNSLDMEQVASNTWNVSMKIEEEF